MYTQCPDCQTAFQVTAKVLQQAGGKVRCGGCGNAFNALDYLSEDLPETPRAKMEMPVPEPDEEIVDDEQFEEQTSALLETLDELAGPDDIRIEDTGVEWRVLDEVVQESLETGDIDDTSSVPIFSEPLAESDDAGHDSRAQESFDLPVDDAETFDASEMRFDDNTPLPDDFDDLAESTSTPQRRADDVIEESPQVVDDLQEDLELGELEDWEKLLDEVAVGIADDKVAVETIHGDLSAPPDLDADHSTPIDDSPTTDIPLYVEPGYESGLELPKEEDLIDGIESVSAIENLDYDEEHDSSASDDDTEEDENAAAFAALRESTGAFEKQIAVAQEELHRQLDGDFAVDSEDRVDESAEEPVTEISGEYDELAHATSDDAAEPDEWPDEQSDDEAEEAPDPQLAEEDRDTLEEFASDEEIASELADQDEPQTADSVDEALAEDESIVRDDMEESTGDDIGDIELAADAEEDDAFDPSEATIAGVPASLLAEHSESGNVETIIMEGEFIRGSMEKQGLGDERAATSQIEDPVSLVDTYAIQRGLVRGGRRRGDPATLGMIAAVVVLALALTAQILHNNREMLSTYGAFNQTLAPVYRVVGNPVTPRWDVKGWQFEATNGATDEEERVLTIFSRIINRSENPLPYPLVHVSLTDRWEEIIGSRVLEPNEYLAGDLDPSRLVPAGENFTAVITVASPSTEATGFKLNVCYRVSPGRVRCATEDFKE